MKISADQLDDKTRIAARLIDLICDMSVAQQLELLKQLDKKQYKGGRSDYRRSRKIAVDYEVNEAVSVLPVCLLKLKPPHRPVKK
jgi:hypothetical protein